jgi:hypothetical protein
MNELQDTLAKMGLAWDEVWRLTADRRAGTLVVVARDGRKFTASLSAGNPSPPRRVKAIKRVTSDE